MGVVPQSATVYEVLEEVAITVQQQLIDAPLPFCAPCHSHTGNTVKGITIIPLLIGEADWDVFPGLQGRQWP